MRKELTQIQHFALELFRALGEHQIIRSFDDMMRKIEPIPTTLKEVEYQVNEELRRYAQTREFGARQICRFKAGDKIIRYETYPTRLRRFTDIPAVRVWGKSHAR